MRSSRPRTGCTRPRIQDRRGLLDESAVERVDILVALCVPGDVMQSRRTAIVATVGVRAGRAHQPERTEAAVGTEALEVEAAFVLAGLAVTEKPEHRLIERPRSPRVAHREIDVMDQSARHAPDHSIHARANRRLRCRCPAAAVRGPRRPQLGVSTAVSMCASVVA